MPLPNPASSEAISSTSTDARRQSDTDETTTCTRCGESNDLAKVKGCITCLKCGFKFDCNGW